MSGDETDSVESKAAASSAASSTTGSRRTHGAHVAAKSEYKAYGRHTKRHVSRKKHPFLWFIRDTLIIILIALVASWAVRTFLFRTYWVPSGSMESTLQINDRIIVNNLYPNQFSIKRGDVIVFTDPGGWLSGVEAQSTQTDGGFIGTITSWLDSVVGLGGDQDNHLVKRVIGIGGDEVSCCDAEGRVQVNGVSIDETYLDAGVAPSLIKFDVMVPAGDLWVMGDNRAHSGDSRWHMSDPSKGFVPLSDVSGRALLVSWPLSHWATLPGEEVFANVPGASSASAAGTK